MAGGPYKNKSDKWYYCKWSNSREHPTEPKISESLKTDSKKIAVARLTKLEKLYNKGKHDPWITKWYDNFRIKHLIYGSLFDSDVQIKDIPPPRSNHTPSLWEAKKLYFGYKRADNPAKKQSHEWNPETTEQQQKSRINLFVNFTGPAVKVNQVTDEHLKSFIDQPSIQSDHTIASYIQSINTFTNYWINKDWIPKSGRPTYNAPDPQANIPVFLYNDELMDICRYKINKVDKEVACNAAAPDNTQRYMPLAWLLIRYTGLRPIELQKLYLDALNLSSRQLRIGKKIKGQVNRTKTAVQRTVPMNPLVYEICKMAASKDFRNSDRWMKKSDQIFGRSSTQSKKRLSDEFTEARRAVLPHRDEITLYTLRDTRAVELLTQPLGEKSQALNPMHQMYNIRDEMGHKSLKTTQKYWKAVPPVIQQQRLHNSNIFCKILRKFHKSSIENT